MQLLLDEIQVIYQRLIRNEPDAPSDFIVLLLDPLIKFLHSKYPSLPDSTLATDIVVDSLLKFVQEPARYNSDKSSLWTYLCMDVLGDIRNALDKEHRRAQREVPLDSVADGDLDRNNEIEDLILNRLVPSLLPANTDMENLLFRLRSEIKDPVDWQIIGLICDGERSTRVYAEILGITHLQQQERTKTVKKTKDRLRVQLKRLGVKINEQ